MQWGKVKTIMILILASANLFLAVNLYAQTGERNTIGESYVADAVSAIKAMGYDVDPDVLSRNRPSLPLVRIQMRDELINAIELLMGDEYERINFKDRTEMSGPLGHYTVYGDSSFHFWQTRERAERSPSTAKDFIGLLGLSPGDFQFDDGKYDSATGTGTIVAHQQWRDTGISGKSITFIFAEALLIEASGDIVYTIAPEETTEELMDSVNIFFHIVKNHADAIDPSEIIGMTLVYYADPGGAHSKVVLTPAWEIVSSDGNYLISALNGTILKDNFVQINEEE